MKLIFLGLMVAAAGAAPGEKKKVDPAGEAISQAKSYLAQGQRLQAIQQLDKALTLTKSKKTQKEISERRTLFARQFLTSESFQKYQEAKAFSELSRWDDCIRELSAIPAGDLNNILVLRSRAHCEMELQQYDAVSKTLEGILALIPDDIDANFAKTEIALKQNKLGEAMTLLEKIEPKDSSQVERRAILKARLLDQSGKTAEAIEVLKQDQESNLDHVEVLYELGMLYAKSPNNDWQARKMLSHFVGRCKRMTEKELKARGFNEAVTNAQVKIAEIDKKLGV